MVIASNCSHSKLFPARAPRNRAPDHLRAFNKYSIEQIEEMIHTQDLTLEQMRHSFGDEAVYQNHKHLTQLQADVDAEEQKLILLYEAWEYRAS